MGKRRSTAAVKVSALFGWVRRQSMKVKTFVAVTFVLASLVALKFLVRDHNHFFIASEATHAAGIIALIFKLTTQNTCSGLSLRSQELTAIFLAVRVFCSITMEGDIHTVLDIATLVSTVWVIYMMRFKLKSTYIKELDNMRAYSMVIPCAILSILIYPYTTHEPIFRMLWAFCVYLESISVLPQLRLMQNAKMVEPFTSHYVFALGVARFLGCAHWIIKHLGVRLLGGYLGTVGAAVFWKREVERGEERSVNAEGMAYSLSPLSPLSSLYPRTAATTVFVANQYITCFNHC